jgi:hypothetical protein
MVGWRKKEMQKLLMAKWPREVYQKKNGLALTQQL